MSSPLTQARLKRLIARLRLYRLAALLYEGWRRLVRPHTHGALVAIWHGEKLLLVEPSYRRSWGLPGGGVGRGETARQAAVREVAEELGLRVAPEQLLDPWTITERTAGGLNTVTIFRLETNRGLPSAERPAVAVDGLEIVACHWLGRKEALAQVLPSHVRGYLLRRSA